MKSGETLKALRADKTQEEIARAVGVSKSSWAMYERNERRPSDDVKVRIANYFGKSVQEIFFKEQDEEEVVAKARSASAQAPATYINGGRVCKKQHYHKNRGIFRVFNKFKNA